MNPAAPATIDAPIANIKRRRTEVAERVQQPRWERKRAPYPFECPFNIFQPNVFCIQYGPDGCDKYKACAGPGLKEVCLEGHEKEYEINDRTSLMNIVEE